MGGCGDILFLRNILASRFHRGGCGGFFGWGGGSSPTVFDDDPGVTRSLGVLEGMFLGVLAFLHLWIILEVGGLS